MFWQASLSARSNVLKLLPYPQSWAAVAIPCGALALAQSINSMPFRGWEDVIVLNRIFGFFPSVSRMLRAIDLSKGMRNIAEGRLTDFWATTAKIAVVWIP